MRTFKSALIFLIILFEKYRSIQGIMCYNCTKENCQEKVECADGIIACYAATGSKGDTIFYEADCAPYMEVCGENIKIYPPPKKTEAGAEGSGGKPGTAGGGGDAGGGDDEEGPDENQVDEEGGEGEWRAEEEESMELGLMMCSVCLQDLCNTVQSLVPFTALYLIAVSSVVLDLKSIVINCIYI